MTNLKNEKYIDKKIRDNEVKARNFKRKKYCKIQKLDKIDKNWF